MKEICIHDTDQLCSFIFILPYTQTSEISMIEMLFSVSVGVVSVGVVSVSVGVVSVTHWDVRSAHADPVCHL